MECIKFKIKGSWTCYNKETLLRTVCGTRWSSHTDAVSALSDGYSIVLDVIIKMKKDNLNALSLIELNYLYLI